MEEVSEYRGGAIVSMVGAKIKVEAMTCGIGMKVEAVIAEVGAEIEGIVPLLFRNEGVGDLDLLVV